MIWILPFLVIFGAILWLANGIRQIGAVSSGNAVSGRSGTALLLIDLQTVFWDSDLFNEPAKAAAESLILAEIDAAKSDRIPVIAVRQEWSIPATTAVARLLMNGQAIAGTPGTEIAAPFAGLADQTLVKRVQDAFETKELDKILGQLNVGTLRIVGLDTNYCVAKTALAARQRGYQVEIVKRGVLSADPKRAEKTLIMLRDKNVMLR
ncbi:isochorismatase family cysteine hydrolase [uncultured Pseudosulfitobacter sp.]|uniref:cysteine hydrolase family protein n=1 Tax=uncultured Pseudosulfitobacter sp. TaxID=2854214 RepID=UPI0030D90407|tara:strand:+ start:1901 stop:2524 length:624 start_codon:yes stop_codon:yes gene_type:complete